MRLPQGIHYIQNTARSLEEEFETLAFICVGNIKQGNHDRKVFATINIDITGRANEKRTLKTKVGTQEHRESVTPSNLSEHVSLEYQCQQQTKTRNTEPIEGHHSSRIW